MSTKKTGQEAAAYGQWVLNYRWLILLVSVVLAGLAGTGASKLEFDDDYRIFFSEENPQLIAFEELQRRYTKIDNVLFNVVPKDGNVFTPQALEAVAELTEQAWSLPFSIRVDSITNYQHTVAQEDDLIVSDLVENPAQLQPAQLDLIRQVAVAEPQLLNRLISADGRATGINVNMEMPKKSPDETPQVVSAARQMVADIEAKYPVDVHLTGTVMLNNAFFESSMEDMSTLTPIMYLVILVITYFLVRSFAATFGSFLVLMLSVVTAMGLAGWSGIRLSPPSSAAPTIIMTLAVADSIHVLVSLLAAMRLGMPKNEAIVESLRINLQPIFLTSATTAIGFLSLNFSDAPPFRHLGNITAMGVVAAFFFSVGFLPALLSLLPMKVKQQEVKSYDYFDRLSTLVTTKTRPIFIICVGISVAILSFIPYNQVNDDMVGYFDESTTYRQDVDITVSTLTGAFQLQYSLSSGSSNGVSDPEFMRLVEDFTQWLREQPEVRQASSITDTLKRLNKNLHNDDPSYYRLPEDRELAAQYLLLYELSLPYGLDLNNQLNIDKSSTQVVAILDNVTSIHMRAVAERGSQWLAEHSNDVRATGIGPAIMFAYISQRNIESMAVGTTIALVLIAITLMLALRSFKLGALSLIPNMLPVALSFGVWGATVGQVNVAVSMVAGMTLGIVVDDTVHFLSKYLRGRRENQLSTVDAIRYAFHHVGTAITVTSLILVTGFAVLAQSNFAMNSYMALLTVIAIVAALLADFFLLPALLLLIDRDKNTQSDLNDGDAQQVGKPILQKMTGDELIDGPGKNLERVS